MRGKHIDPEDIVDELSKYDEACRTLRSIRPPRTFLDIIYSSYALELMRENLRDTSDSDGKTLTIDVDNREDERIYAHPIVGFYRLELIFVSGKNRWGLYMNDPGSEFADTACNRYSPADLLAAIYGAPEKTN